MLREQTLPSEVLICDLNKSAVFYHCTSITGIAYKDIHPREEADTRDIHYSELGIERKLVETPTLKIFLIFRVGVFIKRIHEFMARK